MKRILVAYATFAGATAEVAEVIGEVLAGQGFQVTVRPIDDVRDVESYDAAIVGGPMIVGWHRVARRFLQRNRPALCRMPVAVFVLAMSLTETDERTVDGVPVVLDEKLPKPPARAGRLTLRERYAALGRYVRPILRAAGPVPLVGIGLFGGRLEYGRLPWWAVLFAMVAIQAPARDSRNWPAIRAWAAGLPAALWPEAAPAMVPERGA